MTAEVYNSTTRSISYYLPVLIPQISLYEEAGVSTELVLNRTQKNAVFYNITIIGLDNVLQAYTAHLITRKCMQSANTGRRHLLILSQSGKTIIV